MSKPQFKFRRYHYSHDGQFTKKTDWGFWGTGFMGPSTITSDDPEKCVDVQYTGRIGSCGTEIFEDDVVTNGVVKWVVKFHNGAFGFLSRSGSLKTSRVPERKSNWLWERVWVLGNIHENKFL